MKKGLGKKKPLTIHLGFIELARVEPHRNIGT
jgi:hypothetical protein